MLQCVAVCYTVLQCVEYRANFRSCLVLQRVAACCSVLQRVAACCSVCRLTFELANVATASISQKSALELVKPQWFSSCAFISK